MLPETSSTAKKWLRNNLRRIVRCMACACGRRGSASPVVRAGAPPFAASGMRRYRRGPWRWRSRALFIGRGGPTRRGHVDDIRGTGGQNQGSVASGCDPQRPVRRRCQMACLTVSCAGTATFAWLPMGRRRSSSAAESSGDHHEAGIPARTTGVARTQRGPNYPALPGPVPSACR